MAFEDAGNNTVLTGSAQSAVPAGQLFTNVDIYTGAGDGPQIVPQVQKQVYVMNGDPAALTVFLQKLGKFTAFGTQWSWKEHRPIWEATQNSNELLDEGSGYPAMFDVANGAIIPLRAVLYFPTANAYFSVNSKSGNTITGEWLQEPSDTIAANTRAIVISVSTPDGGRGSTMPVAPITTRTNYYADIDIRQQFSDKLLATQYLAPQGSYVNHMQRLLSVEFLKLQEKTMLFGLSASDTSGPVTYWCDGIIQFARESNEVAVGGALTQAAFENNIESYLLNNNAGPTDWVAFMSGTLRRVVSNWYKDDVRYLPGEGKTAGLHVDTLVHPAGDRIRLVTHKMFSLLGLTDTILILNMRPEVLKLVLNKCCAGPKKRLFRNLNGSNSVEVSIRNVFTLECQAPQLNTLLFTGISVS